MDLQETKYITIFSKKRKITLEVSTIIYIHMRRKFSDVYVNGGMVYETRTTYKEFKEKLGEGFIEVRRGTLVSVMAIHSITRKINLNNGESLEYTRRRKKEIEDNLSLKKKKMIQGFRVEGIPTSKEEYRRYYRGFENMPFAFADIEMVFDEEKHAVDWIFRYGNPALAELEGIPLDTLIDSTFGSLFDNMDSKWLRSYERAALFGEVMELMDYSPEIDRYLKVICFPTFRGHCGCILFDLQKIEFNGSSEDTEGTLQMYFEEYCRKYVKDPEQDKND